MKKCFSSKWSIWCILGLLITSLSINIFFLLQKTSIKQYVYRLIREDQHSNDTHNAIEYFDENTPDSIFIRKVIIGGMNMPSNTFPHVDDDITNDWYNSYNWVGLSYWALYHNDTSVLVHLEHLAESFLDEKNSINYEIKSVSQFPIGILFINLYKITGKQKYLEASKNLYKCLVSLCNEEKRIDYFYPKLKRCYVDVLGMIVPFLIEYYETTNDREAYNIAITNILIYRERGTDLRTGIPCHEYDPSTGIKKGLANWGRGIGWYLLALAYCPEIETSQLFESVNHLDYRQYPLSDDSKYDTSVELLFEIFKQSRVKGRAFNLKEIKKHTTREGFIDGCSGDTAFSEQTCFAPFCNGFLLMLITRFSNTI